MEAAAASLLPPREELRRLRSESEFHRTGDGGGAVGQSLRVPGFQEGENSVCEQNLCKVAKLSFGLWVGRCGGSHGGRGILEKRKEASPVPAAAAVNRGKRERE